MAAISPDPGQALPGSLVSAPCGCRFWNQQVPGVDDAAFVIRGCSPSCEVYQYAVAETRRQGKDVLFRESGP